MSVCPEHGVSGGSEDKGRDCAVFGYRPLVLPAVGLRQQRADEDSGFTAESAVNAHGKKYQTLSLAVLAQIP